ncbi:hypothetical protein KC340_g5040 [Hortaea werneckii]|nr:hypothetical protein KC342_g5497 [Hortaea werneckii]KAI7100840.1 hypothetical protein KC339_g7166 [Hortaea werneckii]KAI7242631.1 hypothetical protein KC365_g2970 [Hortaea werneckii]KAI7328550.1 hypothetical protein KC340_g5040 [Hortaea werneckii]KAI7389016.1 hypothetical protein KC328_g8644 [Hortaea werneckii]
MDFLARLIGGTYTPKKPSHKTTVHDPQARLGRFKRSFNSIVDICNRPRDISKDAAHFDQLRTLLDRLVSLINEETRAPAPHLCLQYVASSQAYVVVGRAAGVSQNEAVISSAIAVYAALIDSEEEEFLSNAAFARSLMRLITRVIDSGNLLIGVETETAILEVLFNISAKIRLQPEILSVWFQTSSTAQQQDVFSDEKERFVGATQKNDFPLCYLLVDRVHHEGRIGDFARTGLLYIFEATGRSSALEEWVVSSDLSTLMASGLGALYSQLSRELSLLHPDATLPAVLAMSDYSTTHPRATAESAFSERHEGHMSTFLSYLAFWQDVLDHCRSADVRQTLLDHFQILFLQQLLYPSLLQSSDTDAGSSVAVLTYLTAILESLDYPDLISMLLVYLLAIKDDSTAVPSAPTTPRSPTAIRRRESLKLLTAPADSDEATEPALFSLVDLVINSVSSSNDQTSYSALKLLSTIMMRQKQFALGSLLKIQRVRSPAPSRSVGALELELEKYMELAATIPGFSSVSSAYTGLADDIRFTIEAQVPYQAPTLQGSAGADTSVGAYILPTEDSLLRAMQDRLSTFLTNSVDVNLALTQALVSILSCSDTRVDSWLALDPSSYTFAEDEAAPSRSWQAYLADDEKDSWAALQKACRRPVWPEEHVPLLYKALRVVTRDIDAVRAAVPNLGQLLAGRQIMLQASNVDGARSEPPSMMDSPTQIPSPDASKTKAARAHSRSPSTSSAGRGRKATNTSAPSPLSRSQAASPSLMRPSDTKMDSSPPVRSIFQPPPPETPSTTDVLMQKITLPGAPAEEDGRAATASPPDGKSASLNHILTNIVVLQEFIMELIAVLQVRAAVLGEREVCYS